MHYLYHNVVVNYGNAFFIAAFELFKEMKNMGHKRCSYPSVLE